MAVETKLGQAIGGMNVGSQKHSGKDPGANTSKIPSAIGGTMVHRHDFRAQFIKAHSGMTSTTTLDPNAMSKGELHKAVRQLNHIAKGEAEQRGKAGQAAKVLTKHETKLSGRIANLNELKATTLPEKAAELANLRAAKDGLAPGQKHLLKPAIHAVANQVAALEKRTSHIDPLTAKADVVKGKLDAANERAGQSGERLAGDHKAVDQLKAELGQRNAEKHLGNLHTRYDAFGKRMEPLQKQAGAMAEGIAKLHTQGAELADLVTSGVITDPHAVAGIQATVAALNKQAEARGHQLAMLQGQLGKLSQRQGSVGERIAKLTEAAGSGASGEIQISKGPGSPPKASVV